MMAESEEKENFQVATQDEIQKFVVNANGLVEKNANTKNKSAMQLKNVVDKTGILIENGQRKENVKAKQDESKFASDPDPVNYNANEDNENQQALGNHTHDPEHLDKMQQSGQEISEQKTVGAGNRKQRYNAKKKSIKDHKALELKSVKKLSQQVEQIETVTAEDEKSDNESTKKTIDPKSKQKLSKRRRLAKRKMEEVLYYEALSALANLFTEKTPKNVKRKCKDVKPCDLLPTEIKSNENKSQSTTAEAAQKNIERKPKDDESSDIVPRDLNSNKNTAQVSTAAAPVITELHTNPSQNIQNMPNTSQASTVVAVDSATNPNDSVITELMQANSDGFTRLYEYLMRQRRELNDLGLMPPFESPVERFRWLSWDKSDEDATTAYGYEQGQTGIEKFAWNELLKICNDMPFSTDEQILTRYEMHLKSMKDFVEAAKLGTFVVSANALTEKNANPKNKSAMQLKNAVDKTGILIENGQRKENVKAKQDESKFASDPGPVNYNANEDKENQQALGNHTHDPEHLDKMQQSGQEISEEKTVSAGNRKQRNNATEKSITELKALELKSVKTLSQQVEQIETVTAEVERSDNVSTKKTIDPKSKQKPSKRRRLGKALSVLTNVFTEETPKTVKCKDVKPCDLVPTEIKSNENKFQSTTADAAQKNFKRKPKDDKPSDIVPRDLNSNKNTAQVSTADAPVITWLHTNPSQNIENMPNTSQASTAAAVDAATNSNDFVIKELHTNPSKNVHNMPNTSQTSMAVAVDAAFNSNDFVIIELQTNTSKNEHNMPASMAVAVDAAYAAFNSNDFVIKELHTNPSQNIQNMPNTSQTSMAVAVDAAFNSNDSVIKELHTNPKKIIQKMTNTSQTSMAVAVDAAFNSNDSVIKELHTNPPKIIQKMTNTSQTSMAVAVDAAINSNDSVIAELHTNPSQNIQNLPNTSQTSMAVAVDAAINSNDSVIAELHTNPSQNIQNLPNTSQTSMAVAVDAAINSNDSVIAELHTNPSQNIQNLPNTSQTSMAVAVDAAFNSNDSVIKELHTNPPKIIQKMTNTSQTSMAVAVDAAFNSNDSVIKELHTNPPKIIQKMTNTSQTSMAVAVDAAFNSNDSVIKELHTNPPKIIQKMTNTSQTSMAVAVDAAINSNDSVIAELHTNPSQNIQNMPNTSQTSMAVAVYAAINSNDSVIAELHTNPSQNIQNLPNTSQTSMAVAVDAAINSNDFVIAELHTNPSQNIQNMPNTSQTSMAVAVDAAFNSNDFVIKELHTNPSQNIQNMPNTSQASTDVAVDSATNPNDTVITELMQANSDGFTRLYEYLMRQRRELNDLGLMPPFESPVERFRWLSWDKSDEDATTAYGYEQGQTGIEKFAWNELLKICNDMPFSTDEQILTRYEMHLKSMKDFVEAAKLGTFVVSANALTEKNANPKNKSAMQLKNAVDKTGILIENGQRKENVKAKQDESKFASDPGPVNYNANEDKENQQALGKHTHDPEHLDKMQQSGQEISEEKTVSAGNRKQRYNAKKKSIKDHKALELKSVKKLSQQVEQIETVTAKDEKSDNESTKKTIDPKSKQKLSKRRRLGKALSVLTNVFTEETPKTVKCKDVKPCDLVPTEIKSNENKFQSTTAEAAQKNIKRKPKDDKPSDIVPRDLNSNKNTAQVSTADAPVITWLHTNPSQNIQNMPKTSQASMAVAVDAAFNSNDFVIIELQTNPSKNEHNMPASMAVAVDAAYAAFNSNDFVIKELHTNPSQNIQNMPNTSQASTAVAVNSATNSNDSVIAELHTNPPKIIQNMPSSAQGAHAASLRRGSFGFFFENTLCIRIKYMKKLRLDIAMPRKQKLLNLIEMLAVQPDASHLTCYELRCKGQKLMSYDNISELTTRHMELVPRPYTAVEVHKHVERLQFLLKEDDAPISFLSSSKCSAYKKISLQPLVKKDEEILLTDLQPQLEGKIGVMRNLYWKQMQQFDNIDNAELPTLRILTLEGRELNVMSNAQGFCLANSENPIVYATLLELLQDNSDGFRRLYEQLLRQRRELIDLRLMPPFESPVERYRWLSWDKSDEDATTAYGYEQGQTGIEKFAWNELLQICNDMPYSNDEQRLTRYEMHFKSMKDFVEAAKIGAMKLLQDELQPLPGMHYVYIWENIIYALAHDHESNCRIKRQIQSMHRVAMEEVREIHLPPTARLEYAGKRVLAQALVDGAEQQQLALFKRYTASSDMSRPEVCTLLFKDDEFRNSLNRLAKKLLVRQDFAFVNGAPEVVPTALAHSYGCIGTDKRRYLLHIDGDAPNDYNYRDSPDRALQQGTLRKELLRAFQVEGPDQQNNLPADVERPARKNNLPVDAEQTSLYILNKRLPLLVNVFKTAEQPPLNDAELMEWMHGCGINARYLGALAHEVSTGTEQFLYPIVMCDLIVRAAAQLFRSHLYDYTILGKPQGFIAHFLNCFLSSAQLKTKSAKEGQASNELAYGLSPVQLWLQLNTKCLHYFYIDLACPTVAAFEQKYNVRRITLLRSICLRLGFVIRLQDYKFDGDKPTFKPEDLVQLLPVVKVLYKVIRSPHRKVGQFDYNIKAHYEERLERYCKQSRMQGILNLMLPDAWEEAARSFLVLGFANKAVLFEHQALLLFERYCGAESTAAVNSYLNMALYTLCEGNVKQSTIFFHRALYLLRILSTGVHATKDKIFFCMDILIRGSRQKIDMSIELQNILQKYNIKMCIETIKMYAKSISTQMTVIKKAKKAQ